jgi:hypothetical protein
MRSTGVAKFYSEAMARSMPTRDGRGKLSFGEPARENR